MSLEYVLKHVWIPVHQGLVQVCIKQILLETIVFLDEEWVSESNNLFASRAIWIVFERGFRALGDGLVLDNLALVFTDDHRIDL